MTDLENSTQHSANSPWLDLARAIARLKLAFFGVPLIVMVLTGGATLLSHDRYTATLKVAPSASAQLYLWALHDHGLTETVTRRLDLSKHYGVQSADQAQKRLSKSVQFVSNLQDSYIDVQATDEDPAMAMQIANAYGTGMVDLLLNLHLTDAANAIFELRARRDLAQKSYDAATARLQQPDVQRVASGISSETRLAIRSTAGVDAELTLANTNLKSSGMDQLLRQSLDPNELMSLQERLSTLALTESTRSKDWHPSVADLSSAISALQEQAYWAALIDRIDRRVAVLTSTERNEIKLIPADTPTEPSGPPRLMVTFAAGIAAFMVLLAYVLASEQLRRVHSATKS